MTGSSDHRLLTSSHPRLRATSSMNEDRVPASGIGISHAHVVLQYARWSRQQRLPTKRDAAAHDVAAAKERLDHCMKSGPDSSFQWRSLFRSLSAFQSKPQ
jgi:hypothetical protein